jgi:hypothetical protein
MEQTPTTQDVNIDRQAERDAEARALRRSTLLALGVILSIYVVNALSVTTELRWSGSNYPSLYPWVLEGTAIIAMIIGLPLILWLGRRFPVEIGRLSTSLPIHLVGLLVYGLIQVILMVSFRTLVWPLAFDAQFVFGHSALDFFTYELRKQAMAYVGIQMVLSTNMTIERLRLEAREAKREAQTNNRITLRCGGRTHLVEARGFVYARAAGNYLEARFEAGEQLARMTLTDLERLLTEAGIDPVRVHRSWLVNRDAITEIAPTGEGDVTLTLKSGDRIPGSRRYRDRLAA